MAILYDWYENPGESDDSEEKGLHPRIFLNGKLGTDKLCRMIHGRSSLSVGDVKNAFEMLAQICGEELREGREIHIEGLGYIYPAKPFENFFKCFSVHFSPQDLVITLSSA